MKTTDQDSDSQSSTQVTPCVELDSFMLISDSSERDAEIERLKETIRLQYQEIQDKDEIIKKKDAIIERLETDKTEHEKRISKLEETNSKLLQELSDHKRDSAEKIALLEESIRDLMLEMRQRNRKDAPAQCDSSHKNKDNSSQSFVTVERVAVGVAATATILVIARKCGPAIAKGIGKFFGV